MTTTSIPLSQMPGSDGLRRNQYGHLLVVPPDGGKPVGYARVTTVAKALDDGGGLAPWKATMAAGGIIMRRGLRARWEALLAEHGDPWYAGDNVKRTCKELVEECAAVGGANDRKEIGSALHTITALVDSGRTPTHLTEETEHDINAYVGGMVEANITIVPGQIEVTVVLDTWKVAGTFDRLAKVPGFDLPLIADLKTGSSLDYSWQPFAVQLAAYSRANNVYVQGAAADGSQDQRLPMPAVDQNYGLILWLPVGSGALEMHLVDLNAGWEAFEHSMWARNWRNARPAQPLSAPVPTADSNLEKALEASLAAVEKPQIDTYQADEPGLREATRTWLQDRINAIGAHAPAKKDLGQRWAESGIPTLRSFAGHSFGQLAAIETLLDDVEARWEMPFPPHRKPGDPVARVVSLFPGSTITNTPTDKEPA
jgi:hypothetical protein